MQKKRKTKQNSHTHVEIFNYIYFLSIKMKECTIDCRISAKIKTNKTISEKDSRKTRLKHCLPSNILVLFHKILFKKKSFFS